MLIEFLYPFFLFMFIVLTVVLSMLAWFWWKHRLWVFVDWLEYTNDRVFYWLLDRIFGKAEITYDKNEEGERYESNTEES